MPLASVSTLYTHAAADSRRSHRLLPSPNAYTARISLLPTAHLKLEEEKLKKRPGLKEGEQLFETRSVPPRAPTQSSAATDDSATPALSGLSFMFGGDDGSGTGGASDSSIEDAMELTIYLPDCSSILMPVSRDSTCEDVLNRILRKATKEGGAMKEQLPADDISRYDEALP